MNDTSESVPANRRRRGHRGRGGRSGGSPNQTPVMDSSLAREIVAALIRAVPSQEDHRWASISELASDAGLPIADGDLVTWAVMSLLDAFGALEWRPSTRTDPDEYVAPALRACSPTGKFFLASLAEHIDANLPLLKNWKTGTVSDPPFTGAQLSTAAQFLYQLETERYESVEKAQAIHRIPVSLVIVKARMPLNRDRYLMQFNPEDRQYRPPGGPQPQARIGAKATAIRYLEAELPRFRFNSDTDKLEHHGREEVRTVPTHPGVVTAYDITFWLFRSRRQRLPLSTSDRWVPGKRLLKSDPTPHAQSPIVQGLHQFARSLPNGLDGLPTGIDLSH